MIVGIDLGTTNSAVGVWRDDRVELIPNSLGHALTPSAVSLDDDGRLLVGLAARDRQTTHPALTATSFKRHMGSKFESSLGTTHYLPEELSALILRSLKADAELFLGESVIEAVITVPAYFNDKQRKATRRAGELAGLTVQRLVNEPTAAALAYGIHELSNESQFLVFDLGGGTFDVSVIEIFEGLIEVRSSTGDSRLGGDDFNEIIVDDMRTKLSGDFNKHELRDSVLYGQLISAAERIRRTLTDETVARCDVVWKGRKVGYQLTAADFESRAKRLLDRLRDPVIRALKDGAVQAESLDEIILVGGATRMPIVRRAVTKMFGRFPATRVHPDEAVVRGAAILAGLKARDVALKEIVLTDVCPYSLGVDTGERLPNGRIREGIFSPIIERNTVVPASRVKAFSTLSDGQSKVLFNVYQGESLRVAENIPLGRVEIPVPPRPAGEVSVECRFSYDVNGLIEVDVAVPQTGERRELVIVDEDGLSADELTKMRKALAGLKVHPRDSEASRAALARAARCYETTLGEIRERIASHIARFEFVLEGQDPREVERACATLHAALDELEGKPFL